MSEKKFQIKQMRERAGLSQQQVADVLKIRVGRYGDWERETREINLREAIKLADLFDCTLDELAGRKSPNTQPSTTADERYILDVYRDADGRGRRAIERTVKGVAEDMELDAREKRAI